LTSTLELSDYHPLLFVMSETTLSKRPSHLGEQELPSKKRRANSNVVVNTAYPSEDPQATSEALAGVDVASFISSPNSRSDSSDSSDSVGTIIHDQPTNASDPSVSHDQPPPCPHALPEKLDLQSGSPPHPDDSQHGFLGPQRTTAADVDMQEDGQTMQQDGQITPSTIMQTLFCFLMLLPSDCQQQVVANLDDKMAFILASTCKTFQLLVWDQAGCKKRLFKSFTPYRHLLEHHFTSNVVASWRLALKARRTVGKGITICCTGFSSERRAEVRDLAVAIGASFSGDFHSSIVTHLVVARVGTPKFFAAVGHGKEVVDLSFLEQALATGVLPDTALHAVKTLQGTKVCITGGSAAARNAVERIVSEHGGEYSPNLMLASTTHLIVLGRSVSGKLEAAKQWGIDVVHPRWLAESVIRRRCQRPQDHPPNRAAIAPLAAAPAPEAAPTTAPDEEAPVLEEPPAVLARESDEQLISAPPSLMDHD
jgi:hypothetical protein